MTDAPRSGRDRLPAVLAAGRRVDPLLSSLSASLTGPDMTRRIMGRLGYMKATRRVSRRRRLARAGARAGLMLTAIIAIAIASDVYESSPQARRPVGPTIPAAVGNDLLRQQDRIGNVIQTIRLITPLPSQQSQPADRQDRELSPAAEEQIIEETPAGPYRWV